MKVFVSSTCYDLIDVRGELAGLLRDLGIEPALSDDKLSAFNHPLDGHHARNSIQACLVNVKNSDLVIVILDRRYGPRLGSYGFEDVAATHLEYRHAKEHGIPVHFFARDRLVADFQIHESNQGKELKLSWVKDPKDYGLFDLLREHKPLAEGNNWFDPFTSSVDLKQAVTRIVRIPAPIPLAPDSLEFGSRRPSRVNIHGISSKYGSIWSQERVTIVLANGVMHKHADGPQNRTAINYESDTRA